MHQVTSLPRIGTPPGPSDNRETIHTDPSSARTAMAPPISGER